MGTPERSLQLDVLIEESLAALVVGLSQGGQLQRPFRAVDQLSSEARFEFLDHPGHSGLRKAVGLCRPGEVAEVDQVAEHFERFEGHGPRFYSIFLNSKRLFDKKNELRRKGLRLGEGPRGLFRQANPSGLWR